MPRTLTRRELYDLVWANPMIRVAAEFGISDVVLHKICIRHRVPSPPRGYWAKLAAGKPVNPVRFRDIADPHLDRICIRDSPASSLPANVREARENAKTAAASSQAIGKGSGLGDLHPLTASLEETLAKRKPGGDGYIRTAAAGRFDISVTPASVPRAVHIVDQLIRAAEFAGYSFRKGKSAVDLVVDEEVISFAVTEIAEKVRHEPTERELATLHKWETDRDRKIRENRWYSEWGRPRIPEWDHVPGGRLSVSLDRDNHRDGLRRNFSDGRRQRLETMTGSILGAAAVLAAHMKTGRAENERRQREYEEAARRRKEAERIERLTVKRLEFIDRQAEFLEQAARLEHFVSEYSSLWSPDAMPETCRLLLDWARDYAAAVRHHVRPEKLAPILEKHQLMNDETDIGSWVDFRHD